MTLLVKDANTTTQPLSTGLDSSGNLVPVHAPASIISGVATPVSITTPLPVINTAGSVAVDGSGTALRRSCSAGWCQSMVGLWQTIHRQSCMSPMSALQSRGVHPYRLKLAGSSRRPQDTSRPDQSASMVRPQVKRLRRVGGNERWR